MFLMMDGLVEVYTTLYKVMMTTVSDIPGYIIYNINFVQIMRFCDASVEGAVLHHRPDHFSLLTPFWSLSFYP